MSAVLSPCGKYRYRLERDIGLFGPVAAVVMVNPSTADAAVNDATIRRVIGFGKKFGWSRVIVGNVFAFRATDVSDLAGTKDPVGPDNLAHLRLMLGDVEQILVAWGSLSKLPPILRGEWHKVIEIASEFGTQLKCLGVAKDGHPRHPLMLSYQSELTDWASPSA